MNLLRAEGRLAFTKLHQRAQEAVATLLLVVFGASLFQLTILAIALSPMLVEWVDPLSLGAMVFVPLSATFASLLTAYLFWTSRNRAFERESTRVSDAAQ